MAAPPSVKVQSEDASKEVRPLMNPPRYVPVTRPPQPRLYSSRAHKLAALFIMTAGSAHASRFPTMFIIYGGIPFLLAYLAFLVTVAMPLLYLEGSLAQFAGDGNRGIFSAVPLFMGLGYTMSLYAIVHVLRDSVTLSEHLLHFVGSLRNLTWNECSQGVVGSDRACYDATRQGHAPLCKSVRGRLVESFRRQQLDRGLPASNGDLLALVPAREYREGATACVPGVYDPLHGHHMRRAGIGWSEGAFDEIRVHPLLSLAAVWMLVFALANRGFTTVKNRVCVPVQERKHVY
ncbi:sodium-dependent dopamine transporter-like [Haemaphysalis longicornis]